ncbi:MAG: oxidoreductase, partial [Novosphingobium sp. 16-62-11]
ITWKQEQPNTLTIAHLDGTCTLVRAGTEALGPDAASRTRTPGGHPEGYLEAFANLYRDFAALVRGESAPLLPSIADGVRGMIFIDTAVSASRSNAGWVTLEA